MNRNEIFEKLKEVFKVTVGEDNVDFNKFSENADLTKDLGLNSVGILYLVAGIEEAFDIQFDDVGFNDFKTVATVINYIEEQL